ncbi:hypothetical protein RFN29_31620 [Mesorhizobium sp. VK22B]|uniref:Transposase n=1 Tax=Mesorhizobium captivum TaxID=3072319 RepID=A0ABU4Z9Y4_9HYPH|nr:hypothetical protein [Mesorhizobium sp. VK22B]MDX8496093.1 hypothetical protein [Mesorhizobium sp. VK22B]
MADVIERNQNDWPASRWDELMRNWMAAKTNPRPLVRTMSALDGFVTAAFTEPRFADPQDWMPAHGIAARAGTRRCRSGAFQKAPFRGGGISRVGGFRRTIVPREKLLFGV